MVTVPFVVDTSHGKNLPSDAQSNQQNIKEQKPEIHHLSTLPLPSCNNFVHCILNLLSSKTMVVINPLLGSSKPSNFGKPMDCSHHFHRECYVLDSDLLVLIEYYLAAAHESFIIVGANPSFSLRGLTYYSRDWVLSIVFSTEIKIIISHSGDSKFSR